MYGLVKTHRNDNTVRVITSGCNTSVENLSIFVESILFKESENLKSRIRDTNHMLCIIDDLNNSGLPNNSILVSFDVVNMFPSIHNESGLEAVTKVLNLRSVLEPPTACIIEALRICLECNNSVFNNKHYLQTNGTAQGPHMSCSYSDIAMAFFDVEAENYTFKPTIWKRFRDDVFTVWTHGIDKLPSYLYYLNNLDESGKIKFTMQIAENKCLEFLDLLLKFDKNKIEVDVYSKPTNSFTYVLPTTCYPKRNINNIPKGIALRLRRICDSDNKFQERSKEYKNYLIGRQYKPSVVNKQFADVGKLRQCTSQVSKFITTYNPMLPNIRKLVNSRLHMLHADETMKQIFPLNSITTVFKRSKNLKEMLAPSLYPTSKKKFECSIKVCNKCDICKNYLVSTTDFQCKVTGKKYKIRGNLSCNSLNVIYLISCKNCHDQYVGSASNFKNRFRIHKSDIKTKKDRCGTSNHFNEKCVSSPNIHGFLQVQIIEHVVNTTTNNKIDNILWSREKYWQSQLFTLTHGMNSMNELYCKKRKGHRK